MILTRQFIEWNLIKQILGQILSHVGSNVAAL